MSIYSTCRQDTDDIANVTLAAKANRVYCDSFACMTYPVIVTDNRSAQPIVIVNHSLMFKLLLAESITLML